MDCADNDCAVSTFNGGASPDRERRCCNAQVNYTQIPLSWCILMQVMTARVFRIQRVTD